MLLHAVQEHFGYISQQAVEWIAAKLELQPINIYELVTFYPMLHQKPVGKYHLRVCRTLSCALGGSYKLHEHFCEKLGLDPEAHGPQTTADGKYTLPEKSRLLAAMEHGLPPCSGCALGFDRLVMVATGAKTIQEVMAFPISRA